MVQNVSMVIQITFHISNTFDWETLDRHSSNLLTDPVYKRMAGQRKQELYFCQKAIVEIKSQSICNSLKELTITETCTNIIFILQSGLLYYIHYVISKLLNNFLIYQNTNYYTYTSYGIICIKVSIKNKYNKKSSIPYYCDAKPVFAKMYGQF